MPVKKKSVEDPMEAALRRGEVHRSPLINPKTPRQLLNKLDSDIQILLQQFVHDTGLRVDSILVDHDTVVDDKFVIKAVHTHAYI